MTLNDGNVSIHVCPCIVIIVQLLQLVHDAHIIVVPFMIATQSPIHSPHKHDHPDDHNNT